MTAGYCTAGANNRSLSFSFLSCSSFVTNRYKRRRIGACKATAFSCTFSSSGSFGSSSSSDSFESLVSNSNVGSGVAVLPSVASFFVLVYTPLVCRDVKASDLKARHIKSAYMQE